MQSKSNHVRQKLDYEDEEARRERLGRLFSDISKSDTTDDIPSLNIDNIARARPHAIPESDVLARVKAFLPQFQESTTALLHQASIDPNAVNLENVNKGERMVAMDLGLGVYDAPGAAEGGMEGRGFGPIVESDPSALEGMQDDDDEDEDGDGSGEQDDEDTSDSASSESSDDDDEEDEEGTTTTKK